MNDYRLCELAEIPDDGSAGFDLEIDDKTIRLMAIRRGERVYVYENSCPHRGLTLDFKPGQFLDAEKKRILCSNHIALFQIEDGLCIEGPCRGASLKKFSVKMNNDTVFVTI